MPANKGDRVLFNMRIFLNKGDEVLLNETQAEHLPKEMIRVVGGVTLIDRTIVLGRREAMAGVEHACRNQGLLLLSQELERGGRLVDLHHGRVRQSCSLLAQRGDVLDVDGREVTVDRPEWIDAS